MDEPSLYSRALTAAEVFALYDAGASGKCKAAAAPSIDISFGAGANLNVSWSAEAIGFRLESTTNLIAPWQPWPGSPLLVQDRLVFEISPTNQIRFFRLQKP